MDTPQLNDKGRLLTPAEVAAMFRVDPKTVTRWAAAGRLPSIRTPGGHRRFYEADVKALMEGGETGGLTTLSVDPLDPAVLASLTGRPAIEAVAGDLDSWENRR